MADKAPVMAEKQCFLITPIGAAGSVARKRADWIHRCVAEVCASRNIRADRADTMPGSPMITSRIFGAVTGADFCIADLSDLNANVFYELGVRHAVRKPIIHIAEEGTALPFDNAQHEVIFYDLADVASVDALKERIGAQLDGMAVAGYIVSNPLTAALGTLDLAKSGDPKDQVISQLSERVEALERRTASPRIREQLNALQPLEDPENRILVRLSHLIGGSQDEVSLGQILPIIDDIPPWRSDIARSALAIARVNLPGESSEIEAFILRRFPSLKDK